MKRNRIDVPTHPLFKKAVSAAARERGISTAEFMRRCAYRVMSETAEREALVREMYPQRDWCERNDKS